jgi:hypothetical protein
MFDRIRAFLWGAVMILVAVSLLVWSSTSIVAAADIAQNGKVANAKVLSSRMESRRSGRRSVRLVYVHQVQFDGKRASMDLMAPRPDGSQMKVIYLKSNPSDVRLFVSRDWGDVLGWTTFNWLLAVGLPIVFLVAGSSWLIAAFRRRGRARRAGAARVVVTSPAPYPPTSGQYPSSLGQYPAPPAPGQWPPPGPGGGYPPQR